MATSDPGIKYCRLSEHIKKHGKEQTPKTSEEQMEDLLLKERPLDQLLGRGSGHEGDLLYDTDTNQLYVYYNNYYLDLEGWIELSP